MEVAEEVFDIHITNPTPIVTPTTVLNTNKTMAAPTLPQFNPRVLVCVAISGQRAAVSLYCFFGNRGDAHGNVDTDREERVAMRPAANHSSDASYLAVCRAKQANYLAQ